MLFEDTPLDIKISKNKVLFSISQNRVWMIFLAFNFAFITLDIYIAHFLSQFLSIFINNGVNPADTKVLWEKFIPFIFSPIFAIFLLIAAITDIKSTMHKIWIKFLSLIGIIIGAYGVYFHLEHNFHFSHENLGENIIFGPPLFAPVMFIILSLYILYILSENNKVNHHDQKEKCSFLVYLTGIQFLILALLSASEHSHNYFASIFEWLPLVVGFFIFSFLLLNIVFSGKEDNSNTSLFSKIYFFIMLISIFVGIAGFGFHVFRNATQHTHGISNYFIQSFVGSPIFAPLLFANASIFGMLVYLKIYKNN